MVRIKLFVGKTIEENAGIYFERIKKFKGKLDGAKNALVQSKVKLKELETRKIAEEKSKYSQHTKPLKKEWYEKFRWFRSSEGFLVIGGRDASTNDILIKKFTENNDIVFHTEMAGSPFFVVKSDNKPIGKQTIQETADATASFSKAWKLGLSSTEVYNVNPEQVSKKAPTGEYITKGAFMIYGKKNNIDNSINLAVGMNDEGKIFCAPLSAVKANSKAYMEILHGDKKPSEIAKMLQKIIGGSLDDIIRALPSGGCKIKKEK